MKISIDTDGAEPVRPAFDVLRASLVSAQAATPTARASAAPRVAPAGPASLVDVYATPFATSSATVPAGSFSVVGKRETGVE